MSNAKRSARWVLAGLLLAGAGQVAAQECGGNRAPGTVLRGTVVDEETRVPLQGAGVRLGWVEGGRARSHEAETDSTGGFRLCDPPTGTPLTVGASFWGDGPTQARQLAAGDSVDLTLEVDAPHSVLGGRVQQEPGGTPVADVEVRVLDTPLSALTDARGEFTIPAVPPGKYRVQLQHLRFGTRTDTVTVDFRSRVQLVASVAETAIPLPPLEVTVRSEMLDQVGFYERQTAGFGEFLTRREWEPRSPRLGSDLLRMVPGMRVVPSGDGYGNVILDRRNCAVRYFVDGARVGANFRLDEIPVYWIEALEIYRGPSQVPAQFRGFPGSERGGCGVIVIWTRRAH